MNENEQGENPPSYEEATGLARILPGPIGRQITRLTSSSGNNGDSEGEGGGKLCAQIKEIRMYIGLFVIFFVVPATMIGVGAAFLGSDSCRTELPFWLLAGGIGFLASIAFLMTGAEVCFYFVGLLAVMQLFWYGYGCYLTWPILLRNLPASERCSLGVVLFCYGLTLAPVVLIFLLVCCCRKK